MKYCDCVHRLRTKMCLFSLISIIKKRRIMTALQKSKRLLILSLGLTFSVNSNAQYQFFEEHDRSFFKSTTLLFGSQFYGVNPAFEAMNYRLMEESSVYDFSGTMYGDSTNFARRSNFLGLGFNANNMQFLISGGFRRSTPLRMFHFGFGLGFNHVLHFSYKTGQPKVWFEGLLNYTYLNTKIRIKSYDVTQPPMAFFEGVQFPDIPEVVGGKYHFSIDSDRHIFEPVMALNFALSRGVGLRFSAAYMLF